MRNEATNQRAKAETEFVWQVAPRRLPANSECNGKVSKVSGLVSACPDLSVGPWPCRRIVCAMLGL